MFIWTKKKYKAFTLMELMIVIVIIGILAAVGMVTFGGQSEKAKIAATKSNINLIVKKLKHEMVLCEASKPNDLAYVGGAGGFKGIKCSEMIAGGSPWNQIANAVTTYHQDFTNVYNKKRPGISSACNGYELSVVKQESFVGTIWFCAISYKADIYTCYKSPCSDTSNQLRFTVNRGN